MTDVLCPSCRAELAAPILCQRCTDRARRDLDQIGHHRRMLDPLPKRGTSGRPSSKPGSRPPADLTVLTMTDGRSRRIIAGWHDSECGDKECTTLARTGKPCADPDHRQDKADDVACVDAELLALARMVSEERQLSAPIRDALDCLRVLNISFDWMVRHPAADEHIAVLSSCAFALSSALRDRPDPPLGRCPAEPRREGDDSCGGPMRWVDGDSEVRCGACGSTWTLLDLQVMGRVVALDIWGTVPDVAKMLDMSERTLRHWAMTGKVRKDGFGRVHHGQVWRRIQDKSDPQQRLTAEGLSTT